MELAARCRAGAIAHPRYCHEGVPEVEACPLGVEEPHERAREKSGARPSIADILNQFCLALTRLIVRTRMAEES
jgi:hypothetical protein